MVPGGGVKRRPEEPHALAAHPITALPRRRRTPFYWNRKVTWTVRRSGWKLIYESIRNVDDETEDADINTSRRYTDGRGMRPRWAGDWAKAMEDHDDVGFLTSCRRGDGGPCRPSAKTALSVCIMSAVTHDRPYAVLTKCASLALTLVIAPMRWNCSLDHVCLHSARIWLHFEDSAILLLVSSF